MLDAALPAHSPLGASGSERYLECPGSRRLFDRLGIQTETDEPDYRANGTAAHEMAARCLRSGQDAWELIGETCAENGREFTGEMAEAVQVYLDHCRPLMTGKPPCAVLIEEKLHAPIVHDLAFGTIDFGAFAGPVLDIADYKHGEGIVVEVDWNPQFLYYAYLLLMDPQERCKGVDRIRITVVQPRAFHPDGPVRTWEVSAAAVYKWGRETLIPGMKATEADNAELAAGPWCRFCPAKLVCPVLTGLFKTASTADPAEVIQLSDQMLGLSYAQVQGVKMYLKALEDEVFRRLMTGTNVPEVKLVQKKANRVWKDQAQTVLEARLGKDNVFTVPTLKSPAEIDKLGSEGKQLTAEWAYTPNTGFTVALASDKRVGVVAKPGTEVFAAALAKMENDG